MIREKKKIDKKKIIIVFVVLLVIIGVFVGLKLTLFKEKSPTGVVEEYLNSYNKLDESIVSKIEYDFDDKLDKKQKKEYVKVMKRQYQKMFYSILSENVEEEKAVINAEVTVFDYNTCYNKAVDNITEYPAKFPTTERQIEFKFNTLNTCKDKITHPITFRLRKAHGDWLLDRLTEDDLKKINGTY